MNDPIPESFDFSGESLTPVTIPVKGPNGKSYVLREATAEVAKNYRMAVMKSAKMSDGKMSFTAEGTVEAEPILVAGCLFEVYEKDGKSHERPVTLGEILRWKYKHVNPLFKAAVVISGLKDEDEGKESDDSGKAGTPGTIPSSE